MNRIAINKIVIFLFWLFLFYAVVQFYNPLRFTSKFFDVNKTFYFLPQGWGFFTKSPQEDLYDFYQFKNGEYVKVNYSNADMQNSFGLSKNARLSYIEIGKLLSTLNVSKSDWIKIKGLDLDKITNTYAADTIEVNPNSIFFTKNQEYVLVKHKTIPFAWSEKEQEKHKPYEVVKIYTK